MGDTNGIKEEERERQAAPGSSHLLGNRKGLGGLKNKKREISQAYMSK